MDADGAYTDKQDTCDDLDLSVPPIINYLLQISVSSDLYFTTSLKTSASFYISFHCYTTSDSKYSIDKLIISLSKLNISLS